VGSILPTTESQCQHPPLPQIGRGAPGLHVNHYITLLQWCSVVIPLFCRGKCPRISEQYDSDRKNCNRPGSRCPSARHECCRVVKPGAGSWFQCIQTTFPDCKPKDKLNCPVHVHCQVPVPMTRQNGCPDCDLCCVDPAPQCPDCKSGLFDLTKQKCPTCDDCIVCEPLFCPTIHCEHGYFDTYLPSGCPGCRQCIPKDT